MDFIKWDEKYSVGVDEIDSQHRELFKLLNKMIGMMGKASKAEVIVVLDEMVHYTSFHFQAEEKYYMDHPDYPHHHHEHEIFIQKNAKLQKAVKETNQDISVEVMDFLLKWLKNHILKTDIHFFAEIKSRQG